MRLVSSWAAPADVPKDRPLASSLSSPSHYRPAPRCRQFVLRLLAQVRTPSRTPIRRHDTPAGRALRGTNCRCLGPTNHHTDKPRRLYRQILSHADVDDLLLLRQTSKSLYRLLRGSDGEAVWSRFFANKGLPVLKAGVLKPWQYAEMALCRRCTVCLLRRALVSRYRLCAERRFFCHAQSCTKPQFIPDFYVLRRHCRKCRKETMFRLTHLKKNYPNSHPCRKLCVLESHCKFLRQ